MQRQHMMKMHFLLSIHDKLLNQQKLDGCHQEGDISAWGAYRGFSIFASTEAFDHGNASRISDSDSN